MLKNLVSTRGERPPLRKYAGKKSMSVLIGIICPDAIILATDSQITDLYTGEVSNVNKISVVEFWPNDDVLIAQGGLWPLTNRIVEKIQEKAKGVRISNPQVVTKIVEDSIRESKFHLDNEQQDYINRCSSGLLIAFYVDKKPYLYTVDCYGSGIVNAAETHYATIGAGASVLANYLLNEYVQPKSHSDFAIAAAIFAISKVKEHQKALCGGDTIIRRMVPLYGFIDLDKQYISKSEVFSKEFVDKAELRLMRFDDKTKKSRGKKVVSILQKIGMEMWAKHIKKFQDEQELKQAEAKKQIGAAMKKHLLPSLLEAHEKHKKNNP
jgi:20S proteasome alpha/beta subunit